MKLLVAAALLLTIGSVARPTLDKRWDESSSVAQCKTFYADIYASTDANLNLTTVVPSPVENNQQLTQFFVDVYKTESDFFTQVNTVPKMHVEGIYSLYFQYCEPKSGSPKGLIQTHHGGVATHEYWSLKIDNKTDNSFVESATAAGWATLSYDRLGVGRSDHPDGTKVVQAPYEIAQSISIANTLRSGNLSDLGSFETIIGLGHSFGSSVLAGVAGAAPDTFDAIVLTGFSGNGSTGSLGVGGFQPGMAALAYPDRFSGLPGDYISTTTQISDQQEFFHYPNYTTSALDLFTATKGEYTLGEVTSMFLAGGPTRFSHPVLVLTGENDGPLCAGDCYVTSLPNGTNLDTARALFPQVAASDFETVIVPATGHGINFREVLPSDPTDKAHGSDTTAYDAYQQILAFVDKHAS